ncbi:NAD+ synthase [Methanobrevibacter curvatus]|uniref:NH(3)-dependent NAD(+) synthetase n=1 Tax=Methanobrevibacter curvatus TaxID=49547 RepID=A0A166B2D8_9EURY|nr:NAD+ synthase [Methanobrevibacter curvatus]KZX12779.1 NH(3)-dependent NAD(+) synthetase [Methanobrevibacter curvatus]
MFKVSKLDSDKIKKELISFVKDIVKKSNSSGIIIGLSGGIDSSVVAYLLTEALGKDKVFAYHLYSSTTPKEDTDDSRLMAKILDIEYHEIPIDDILNQYLADFNSYSNMDCLKVNKNSHQLSTGNLKARIRMSILYYFASLKNSLVAGTGNRSELLIGYFTKFGDGACDFELIGDVYKSQLKLLARHWNIPEQIFTKPPNAGLWDGQTDEEEIGMTYELLDSLLYYIVDKELNNEDILEKIAVSSDRTNGDRDTEIIDINIVDNVREKIEINKHKIDSPPSPFKGNFSSFLFGE